MKTYKAARGAQEAKAYGDRLHEANGRIQLELNEGDVVKYWECDCCNSGLGL